MFVIDVIPLAKGAPVGTLSYRHREPLTPGTVLSVPLRKQKIYGIVVSATPVQEAKATLKRAGYMLRASDITIAGQIPESLLSAAHDTAAFHAASLGSVLEALLTQYIPFAEVGAETGVGFTEIFAETTTVARIKQYEKIIKMNEGEGLTTLLIAPTLIEAKRFAEHFSHHTPVLLTGELTGKRKEAALAKAVVGASLVIATPSFAWLPCALLGAIIIERAGAASYVGERRPYLDMRRAARAYATAREVTFILGDLPLPIAFRPKAEASLSRVFTNSVEILDVRTKDDEDAPKEKFRAVPDALRTRISAALKKGNRVAVLAARKGYAPAVVCRDCGNLTQDEFGRVLTFASVKGKPILRSADGKTVRDAEVHCRVCSSWNLLPLGIGIERVVEELRAAFPENPLAVFDTDQLRSKAAARNILALAREPGALLVGTEGMLPYLDPSDPVEEAVIASADSLLALPFWTARERLVRIGLSLRERTNRLTIASRQPDDLSFVAISAPHDTAFWKEEAGLRKQFSYPPFGGILMFRADTTPAKIETLFTLIKKAVPNLTLTRLPDRRIGATSLRLTAIIKLPTEAWPNEVLAHAIAALPPLVRVSLDPDSLW